MKNNVMTVQPGNETLTEELNRRLFFRVMAALESEDEAMRFFEDLCTPKEITFMAQRVAVAELLAQDYTYGAIIKTLKRKGYTISTATINRVNNQVRYGKGHLKNMILRVTGIEGC